MGPDDLGRTGSNRISWSDVPAQSLRDIMSTGHTDIFSSQRVEEEEEELRWAAIERLPTYDRLRKGVLRIATEDGKIVENDINLTKMDRQDKKILLENIFKVVDEDNEVFLRRLRDRIDT